MYGCESMHMKFVSILRNEANLIALYWEYGSDDSTQAEVHHANQLLTASCFLRSSRLEDTSPSGEETPRTERLLAAWRRLCSVRQLNARVLADVLTVILETRSAPTKPKANLPALDPDAEKRVFRPTAAHPRSHRGKRDRRPKPRMPRPYDLRLYLLTPDAQTMTLRRLMPFWPEARDILVSEGYSAEQIARITFSAGGRLDPYWQYHHGPGDVPAMPKVFSHKFLWSLRGHDEDHVRQAIVAFQKLEIDLEREGTEHLLEILTSCGVEEFMASAEAISSTSRRRELAILLSAHSFSCRNMGLVPEDVRQLDSASTNASFSHQAAYFLSAIKEGVPKGFLFVGLELASRYLPDYEFETFVGCEDVDGNVIEELVLHAHMGEDSVHEEGAAKKIMQLWVVSGQLPGLTSSLKNIDWRLGSPELAMTFLDLLLDFQGGYRWIDGWSKLRDHLPILYADLRALPEGYQEKYVAIISEAHWSYFWEWPRPRACLPIIYQFAARLSRPPYSKTSHPESTLCSVVCCSDDARLETIAQAPQRFFEKLDSHCQRRNDANLIGRGISTLSHELPSFIDACIYRYPTVFFRAAKAFGILSRGTKLSLIATFIKHPVMAIDWRYVAAERALEILQPLVEIGLRNPISKKLRQHVQDGQELTEGQLERCLSQMRNDVLMTQLGLLERLAKEAMLEGFPDIEKQEGHAIAVMRNVQENRRILRRFLKAFLRGDRDFLFKHPVSRRWLEGRDLDETKWRTGIDFDRELPDTGEVQIQIEQNPLEALKLGTYAGTCLGLGGEHLESAAATVVDVNKQVIYARDAQRRVLARQVVAISESNELVCFQVYPLTSSTELTSLFREFDRRFAEYLGLSLLTSKDKTDGSQAEYSVAQILSKSWRDDGALVD